MDFLIRENLTVATPNLTDFFIREAAHGKGKRKRIIVEIAAIHEGITKNFNKYTAEELEKATLSWMTPYPKPLLLNHDMNTEPLGRMVNADFKKNLESESFIQLRAAVIDPVAASKVIDGRYLTGSVGGVPAAALCSICHSDIIAASREGARCGHVRGEIYDERVCNYEHRDITFHEYSFVNAPGDTKSQIKGHITESDASLSAYSVDFDAGSVSRFLEKEGFIDVRELMSESDAQRTYLDIAFGSQYANEFEAQQKAKNIIFEQNISTIATESGSSDLEQNQMTDQNAQDTIVENDDEDILDVTDRLSTDLSEESKEADEKPEVTEEAEPDSETIAEEATEETEPVEETEEAVDEPAAETEETPTEEAAEVTDENLDTEVDTTDSEEASTQEPEVETEESEEVTEPEADAEVSSEEEADAKTEDEVSVTELQARVDALEAENTKLREQNKKMKDALHAELAEKVVDARIAVGHLEAADREEALAEHKTRSATSLADALVDIRSFAEKNNFQVTVVNGTVPSLDIKAAAISEGSDSENAPIESEKDEDLQNEKKPVDPSEILVKELTSMLSLGTEKYLTNRKNKLT